MSDSESRKESRSLAQELTRTVDSDGSKTPTGPSKSVTVGWVGSAGDGISVPATVGNVRVGEAIERGG